MSPALTQQLLSRYASLFCEDKSTSIALFGFECEDGWFALIEQLCEDLLPFQRETTIAQIKEKFGTLRVYLYGPPEALDLADDAEEQSRYVCELCGKPGLVRNYRGWYRCYCAACYPGQ